MLEVVFWVSGEGVRMMSQLMNERLGGEMWTLDRADDAGDM